MLLGLTNITVFFSSVIGFKLSLLFRMNVTTPIYLGNSISVLLETLCQHSCATYHEMEKDYKLTFLVSNVLESIVFSWFQ